MSIRGVWESQPSVRKVVSFMASTVAALPWRVYRAEDGGRERLHNSPAETLVRRPTRFTSSADLVTGLALDWLLYGSACAVLVDEEIVRVPAPLLMLSTDVFGRVNDVATVAGGETVSLSDLPVALMHGWDPDGSGAVAPVRTLRALLAELSEAEGWRRRMWTDVPRVSAQVTRPKDAPRWSDEKRERFLQAMADFKSSTSGGSIPVMEDGMKLESAPQVQPDLSSASSVRTLTDIEVAGYFGVPPELLGMREANYGGYAALRRDLYTRVLGPLIGRIEDALNAEIVPALAGGDASVYGVLDRTEAQDGTLLERVQALQSATGGPVMTRAEARERLDLPYLEGTEELIVPLNVIQGGQASPTDSGSQNLAGADTNQLDHRQQGEATEEGKSLDPKARVVLKAATSRPSPSILESMRKAYIEELRREGLSESTIEKLAKRIEPYLAKQAVDAANGVILESGTGTETIGRGLIRNYIRRMAEGKAEAAVEAAMRLLGLTSRDDSAQDAVRETIADVLTDDRLGLWADASVKDAAGFGSHEGARRSGAVKKMWVHNGSSHPRAEHAAMNGETVDMDATFSNGMRWPHDWGGGDADQIVGCNCDIAYVWRS
uniref:Portal protein n=1 Tax=Siphoviridae sp. ct45W1 TaxID=2823562 RepID=A0A8S5L6P5_9CAUD|nr:MAG TPA: portal protein [Siphoviridae sp. ct45W1]